MHGAHCLFLGPGVQRLFLGDVLMLDPLTLLDYPEVLDSEEVYIRVEGNMEEVGRK